MSGEEEKDLVEKVELHFSRLLYVLRYRHKPLGKLGPLVQKSEIGGFSYVKSERFGPREGINFFFEYNRRKTHHISPCLSVDLIL